MTGIGLRQLRACGILGLALAGLGYAQDRTLSVDSGRPLDEAVAQLQARYGWLITYQDPPYEHPDDMEPSKDAGPKAPRNGFIAPRHRRISVTYPEPRTGTDEERRKIIDGVVESFSAAGAGHFRVYHQWIFSHVVPTSVKRVSGAVESVTSLCDSTVTMSPAKRSIGDSVTEILSQVSQQMGRPAIIAMVDPNFILGRQYLTEAQNENACDALTLVFEDVNGVRNALGFSSSHVAWAMRYDIATKTYYFNVGPVPTPAPSQGPHIGHAVPWPVEK